MALDQLIMTANPGDPIADAEKEARLHAWSHFAYHAQQRQTVFNFYLVLMGASAAGFASTLGEQGAEHSAFRAFIGASLAILSLLFFRLDKRNARLVKI